MFCSNCGYELTDSMNFCPCCGAALNTSSSVSAVTNPGTVSGYHLSLMSLGSCPKNEAADLLEDLIGYDAMMAEAITEEVPCEIAEGLTAVQAKALAQALTEYGMKITVYDENENCVNVNEETTESVFNKDGSLLAGIAAVFAGITALNRLTKPKPVKKPSFWEWLFKPKYVRTAKPVHVRRNVQRKPEPKRVTVQKPGNYRKPNTHGTSKPGNSRFGMSGNPGMMRQGGNGRHGR